MTYKPGDKVWVKVSPGHKHKLPAGDLAAVVLSIVKPSDLEFMFWPDVWYSIDILAHPTGWRSPERQLSPRHDPYEGDQAGSWDTCPYNPEKVVA